MSADAAGRRREELGVAALAALPLLPFLDTAVSIDAPVFVDVALRILETPADPFGFEMVWDPTSAETARFNRNPPLFSYWLAAWIAVFGERDWALHAAVLPFAPWAALAFLGIARRLAPPGLWPTLLLVTTPAFLVLGTSVLLDVPLLAFVLGGVYALLRSTEADAARWQWTAGGLAAAAGLVKYVGFTTLPLLGAGALLLAPERGRALLRVMAPPLLVWAAWGAYTASLYGEVHYWGSTDVVTDKSFEPDEFWNQLASVPVFYGCALVFPIVVWARALVRSRHGGELAVAGLLAGTAVAYWVIPDGEPSRRNPIQVEEAVFAALGFAGACVVWGAALRPTRWRDDPAELFLALWLGGLAVFSALLNWHVNAADALLAAPPALLLLFRGELLRPGPKLVAVCVAGMLPLSVLLAAADAVQSNFYREAARRVEAEIGDRAGARWTVGQWGLQHYMGRVGFEAVQPPTYGRSELAVDDWVATARNVSQMDVDVNMQRYAMVRVWEWEKRSWLPLRTTNPDAGAGFYSHHYGYTPFAVSRLPFEQVQLGRVVRVRGPAPPQTPDSRGTPTTRVAD